MDRHRPAAWPHTPTSERLLRARARRMRARWARLSPAACLTCAAGRIDGCRSGCARGRHQRSDPGRACSERCRGSTRFSRRGGARSPVTCAPRQHRIADEHRRAARWISTGDVDRGAAVRRRVPASIRHRRRDPAALPARAGAAVAAAIRELLVRALRARVTATGSFGCA